MNQISMGSPLLPHKSILRSIVPMANDNSLFVFAENTGALSNCQPGQFVELWVPGVGECPISVCSGRTNNSIELLVRKVGRVTSALFQLSEGDWVGLRGPYGRGFPLAELKGKNLCLVAGGLGVAPIRSLWQYVLEHREDFGRLILVYGMRHSIDLLFRQELKLLLSRKDVEVYLAAEDVEGPNPPPLSVQLGRVTDMLRISPIDSSFSVAVCGPPVMYKFVVNQLKAQEVNGENIWLSLERHMKCGIGKCGHCFVGGTFTCRSGPVFRLTELEMLPEAIECEG